MITIQSKVLPCQNSWKTWGLSFRNKLDVASVVCEIDVLLEERDVSGKAGNDMLDDVAVFNATTLPLG
jgi:hypothetical protein